MYRRYNDKQVKILTACGHYKYIGYSQMKRLNIEAHSSNLSTLVKELTQSGKPLMKEVPHRPQYEKKFYLTKKGRDVLMELTNKKEGEIKFPKHKVTTSSQEQKHRSQTINFQIDLDLSCDREDIKILFCDRYFDTTGNTRDRDLKSKTALIFEGNKTIKADMIFMLELSNGEKELYLHEHENGLDSGKSIDKMIQHGKAILKGHAHTKYDYQKAYRTLWIFEYEGVMKAILKKLGSNPFFANMKELFLMKLEQDLGNDIFDKWTNLDGEERKLFYL